MMQDYMVWASAADGAVRALAAVTTDAVEEGRRRHDAAPTAAAALGRTLTGAALLGAFLKDGQKVMVRVLGDGPIGWIVADSDAHGRVRGYAANPEVHLPPTTAGKLDVGGAVGRGTIHVTRDLGLRRPYHGSAPLTSGEIAEDLAGYFAISEQVPSVVALGVLVAPSEAVIAAGGLIVQLLPGAEASLAAYLEERARALPTVTDLVRRGSPPEEMLGIALGALPWKPLDRRPVAFACGCSTERVAAMLASLGERELVSLLEEQGQAEVTCRFCGQVYRFDRPAVEAIIAGLALPRA